MTYDAIIVGARCAGAATALQLARAGARVLLVDRAAFPSDTISGHMVRIPGVACLRRWGIESRIRASGAPALRTVRMDSGEVVFSGEPPAMGGVEDAFAPRRTVIDAILVEAATAAGAELRERFTITGLQWDGNTVTGIVGRSASGAAVSESAHVVIGADGMRSAVARAVEAPAEDFRPGRTCAYYTYFAGVPVRGTELFVREGAFAVALGTNDGLTQIGVLRKRDAFETFRRDVEGEFRRTVVATAPSLAERLAMGRRVERFVGSGDLPFFIRRSYGPGWALVGDAGAHQDPILAQGMSEAYVASEFLASAVLSGLGGGATMSSALRRYQERRDAHVRPLYELSYELAGLGPPPAMFASLARDRTAVDRFFGMIEGTVPLEPSAPRSIAV